MTPPVSGFTFGFRSPCSWPSNTGWMSYVYSTPGVSPVMKILPESEVTSRGASPPWLGRTPTWGVGDQLMMMEVLVTSVLNVGRLVAAIGSGGGRHGDGRGPGYGHCAGIGGVGGGHSVGGYRGLVHRPSDYSSDRGSSSRASSRAGSARSRPSGEPPSPGAPLHRPPTQHDWSSSFIAASASTASTLTSLGGTSSRRGSGETSIAVDNEASIREIKDALVEVGEKYRKAMVSNAQLDNEKNNLMYQVDTLKDSLTELEELLAESRREYEEKAKDHEREKHAHSILQFQFNVMKETLKLSEELLNDIRQLRLKQDGFIREISDLQETVEWKDKKDLAAAAMSRKVLVDGDRGVDDAQAVTMAPGAPGVRVLGIACVLGNTTVGERLREHPARPQGLQQAGEKEVPSSVLLSQPDSSSSKPLPVGLYRAHAMVLDVCNRVAPDSVTPL
ncbi:hypothetical protein CRUP_013492 [Coryphaenoides rupestris]|nr:hypothetical protein CRUP_013492 [Coryphaenoides rupestris]